MKKIKNLNLPNVVVNNSQKTAFRDWAWTPVTTLQVDRQDLMVLLDSGKSHSLLAINGLPRKHVTKVSRRKVQDIWQTCGENSYTTNSRSTHKFSLPKFFAKKIITWEFFEAKSSKKLNS